MHHVLNGQHRFEAAKRVRELTTSVEERMEPPPYTKAFRCKVVRAGMSREVRELIAGSEQSKQNIAKSQSVSDSIVRIITELDAIEQRWADEVAEE